MKKPADSLYASPLEQIVDFQFDEQVANVFADMIQRSVPGYSSLIANTGIIAGQYARENTNIYDLGCSLGATALSMCRRIQQSGVKIIAVDNSVAMVQRCQEYIQTDASSTPIEVYCQDILDTEIKNASVVALNFTLQFIAPEQRLGLLSKICNGLVKDGILLLSEKIFFADLHKQAQVTELHHAFKKANGYSDLEISQKRSALEKVMVSDTLELHMDRLKAAGFSSIAVWFQCLNFVSILATK